MNDAPARISMIMQVMRVVPITLAQKAGQVSVPDQAAIANEPSTPQAAHSVAVAQPSSSETKTSRMSRLQGIRLADSRNLSRSFIGGSAGGVFDGVASDQTMM